MTESSVKDTLVEFNKIRIEHKVDGNLIRDIGFYFSDAKIES